MLVKDLVYLYDFENCPSEITVNDEELEFDIDEDGKLWIHSDSLKLLDKEVKSWSTGMTFETYTDKGCLKTIPNLIIDIRAA